MSNEIIQEVRRQFYTFPEAVLAFGISRITLWRWIRDGKVEVETIGRETLIRKPAKP